MENNIDSKVENKVENNVEKEEVVVNKRRKTNNKKSSESNNTGVVLIVSIILSFVCGAIGAYLIVRAFSAKFNIKSARIEKAILRTLML